MALVGLVCVLAAFLLPCCGGAPEVAQPEVAPAAVPAESPSLRYAVALDLSWSAEYAAALQQGLADVAEIWTHYHPGGFELRVVEVPVQDAGVLVRPTTFAELGVLGHCCTGGAPYLLDIATDYQGPRSPEDIRVTVMHELTHALANRSDHIAPDGAPHLMTPEDLAHRYTTEDVEYVCAGRGGC